MGGAAIALVVVIFILAAQLFAWHSTRRSLREAEKALAEAERLVVEARAVKAITRPRGRAGTHEEDA